MYRRDPLTQQLRLVAPGRAARLRSDPGGCPFCPGHEGATPQETGRRTATDGGESWSARSFPNRYPLTDPHELVVPSRRHVTSWRELTLPELQAGLSLLLERRAAITREGRYVHAFANDGPSAGASISHVHAQLVSLDRDAHTDALVAGVSGRAGCAMCELLDDHELLVERGNHHALFAHPVPRLAGGLVIAPLEHRVVPIEARLADLAELLHRAWLALEPDVDANCWLVADEAVEAHWYIELQPRSAGIAGVELALGLNVSAASAVDTALSTRARLGAARPS